MADEPIYCVNHPDRETTLRCNRCNQPICARCAVLTPVGYRCKNCVKEQQKIFETARWFDFPVAFVASAVICGAGSLLSLYIGLFIIFVAGMIGSLAARIVQALVRHRHSRFLWLTAAAGAAAGCLPVMLPPGIALILFVLGGDAAALPGILMGLLWPAVYAVIAVGMLAASIRGIQL